MRACAAILRDALSRIVRVGEALAYGDSGFAEAVLADLERDLAAELVRLEEGDRAA